MEEPNTTCDSCGRTWESHIWFCPADGELLVLGRAVGGEWVLEKKLGRGAMGAVYRARHRIDGRLAAVKLLGPRVVNAADEEDAQRFVRESMARVRHPSCVEIQDVGRVQQFRGREAALWWIRMDHVDGRTLEDVMSAGPLPVEHVLTLGVQMCAGLQACHQAGVVHRDFKPANVLVENHTDRIRIADFGIARVAGRPTITAPDQIVGTPAYMAPELFGGGRANEQSDLFALGVVLFEMLTGKRPFDPDNTADLGRLMAQVLRQPPADLLELAGAAAADIEPIVMRLLEKNPLDRFLSADEVREALLDLSPVRAHVFNRDLELDETVSVQRRTPLAEVRRAAVARAPLSVPARRILENPRTSFAWDVSGTRIADGEAIARACELRGDPTAVDLHLRAFPDELLGG